MSLLAWLLSAHFDLWHNANLWLLWPVDWLLCYVGWRLMIIGQPLKDRMVFVGATRILCVAHLVAFGLALTLWYGGWIKQDIRQTMTYYGTLGAFIYLSLPYVGLLNYPQTSRQGKQSRHWPIPSLIGAPIFWPLGSLS